MLHNGSIKVKIDCKFGALDSTFGRIFAFYFSQIFANFSQIFAD